MPEYVVSSTLTKADRNNSTTLNGDPAAEITNLKKRVKGTIVADGSAKSVQALAANASIDDFRLMMFPVFLAPARDRSAASLRLHVKRFANDGRCGVLIEYRCDAHPTSPYLGAPPADSSPVSIVHS